MKKLILTLMIGGGLTFGLYSCEGSQQTNDQNTTTPDMEETSPGATGNQNGTMSDTTSMDTTGMQGNQ